MAAMNIVVEIAGKDSGASSLLTGLEGHLGRIGPGAIAVGTALGTLATAGLGAVAGGLGGALSAASSFEAKLSDIKAVSGATGDEMAGLSKLALDLGRDTSFSAGEAAQGISELIKGGVSITDVMSGAATATLNLAAAGGISLADAATIGANALSQFGLAGQDLAHVSDLIAGAANASALSVGDFQQSLKAAGAVAATIGFQFEDLAVGIAVMGQAGITGSDAGTSLKTMMLNLSPATDAARTQMQELGLVTLDTAKTLAFLRSHGIEPASESWGDLQVALATYTADQMGSKTVTKAVEKEMQNLIQSQGLLSNAFFDGSGKVKSMAEVAGELQKATAGLTEQQRIQALQTMFGTDAIRAAAVLAKAGAAGFDQMAGSMGKVSAASVGAEKLNNLSGSLQQLQGSIETAAITLGLALLPTLRQGIDAVTGFVNALIPLLAVVGPQLASALAVGVGQGVDLLKSFLGALQGDWTPAEGITALPLLFGTIGTTIRDAITIATAALTGDFPAATAGLMAGLDHIGAAMAAATGTWSTVLVEWIGPVAPASGAALAGLLTGWLGWLGQALAALVEGLVPLASALIGWIRPQIGPLLTELGALLGALGGWLIGTALPAMADRLERWGEAIVAWVAPQIGPLLTELGALLTELGGWALTTALPAIIDRLAQWGAALVAWVAPQIGPLLLEAVKLEAALGGWLITTGLPALVGQLAQWGAALVAWVAPQIGPLLLEAIKLQMALGTWLIGTALPALVGQLAQWGAAFVDWVRLIVLPVIGERLNELRDAVIDWIRGRLSVFRTEAAALGGALVAGVVSGLNEAAGQIGARLRAIVQAAIDSARQALRDFLGSLPGGGGTSGSAVSSARALVPRDALAPELAALPAPVRAAEAAGTGTGEGGLSVVVNVAGSVLTEEQLVEAIHAGLLAKQRRVGDLGLGGLLA